MSIQNHDTLMTIYVFLIQDSQIMLLRRRNLGVSDEYSVISENIEFAGEVKISASRAVYNRVGFVVPANEFEIVGLMEKDDKFMRRVFYLATRISKKPLAYLHSETNEDIEWHNLEQLPSNLVPDIKYALHDYIRGVIFNSFENISYRRES